MTASNSILSQLLDTFVLSPLNIDSTCFKNSKDLSCINLFMARQMYQNSVYLIFNIQ